MKKYSTVGDVSDVSRRVSFKSLKANRRLPQEVIDAHQSSTWDVATETRVLAAICATSPCLGKQDSETLPSSSLADDVTAMQHPPLRHRGRFSARVCDSAGPCRPRPRAAPPIAAVAPPAVPGTKALHDLSATERVVDVAVAATSNLLNGGIFGAFFGLISGGWTTRSLAGAFSEARVNGKSWGGISCIYAGLQTASRVVRNKDDRFNNVVGACGSGAVFSAKSGPRAAAQGCISFAALSYLIDVFTTPKDSPGPDGAGLSDEALLRKKR